MGAVIDNPILNSPFEEPTRHRRFDEDGITDEIADGRRGSEFFMPIPAAKRRAAAQEEHAYNDFTEDRVVEAKFVDGVRREIFKWRFGRWPGVTATTRKPLDHWTDPDRERRLCFCQVEALETAIWLTEVAPKQGTGRHILNELRHFADDANPGLFRVANRMATGTGKTAVMAMLIENLRAAGVQNTFKGERLSFDSLEPLPDGLLHAHGTFTDAEGEQRTVAVFVGPEHGTVSPEMVKEAARAAVKGVGFDLLVVCGFAFEAYATEAAKEFEPEGGGFVAAAEERKLGRLRVLLTRMNPDLVMSEDLLKKTGAGNLIMVFGEPDVTIERTDDDKVVVELRGVDDYDPTTGEVRGSTTDDIACWFIDTDYNGESFFVRHAYFTGGNDPYEKLKRALKADIDPDAWATLFSTRSRPFDPPSTGQIAIKVFNHSGDEVLHVYETVDGPDAERRV